MDNSFLERLKTNPYPLQGKTITVGFDGFVDTIARVIRQKDERSVSYFETIKEFGDYTSDKTGKNFSLEMEERMVKLGGNMPILASALTNFGANVSCVGSMGYPEIHSVFRSLADKAKVYSYCEPGLSTALEFNDGKILLAQMTALNKIDWKVLREVVGSKILKELFSGKDLIGMVNWSELDHGTDIWRGVFEDIVSISAGLGNQTLGFFDLSDCSRRSDEKIREILALIKQFTGHWRTVLSLNLNEASIVCRVITTKELDMARLADQTKELREKVGINLLVVHTSKAAYACDEREFAQQPSIHLTAPKISTGAGDNFNAGFCTGMLLNMPLVNCLSMGHYVAGHYMQSGESPTASTIIDKSLQ